MRTVFDFETSQAAKKFVTPNSTFFFLENVSTNKKNICGFCCESSITLANWNKTLFVQHHWSTKFSSTPCWGPPNSDTPNLRRNPENPNVDLGFHYSAPNKHKNREKSGHEWGFVRVRFTIRRLNVEKDEKFVSSQGRNCREKKFGVISPCVWFCFWGTCHAERLQKHTNHCWLTTGLVWTHSTLAYLVCDAPSCHVWQ